MKKKKHYPPSFLHPRYWPTWLVIAGLHLLAWLPWSLKMAAGRGLGHLAYWLAKERRHFTEVNIRMAFPERSAAEQQALVRQSFVSNGMGIAEVATALCRNHPPKQPSIEMKGLEYLAQAKDAGQGVLLLSFHFSSLDLAGAFFSPLGQVGIFYKPHRNPLFNRFVERGRSRHFSHQISNHELKNVVRSLRRRDIIWYAPDQDFGRKVSVFAPFFGVSSATINMTSRLIKLTGAALIPMRLHRHENGSMYELEFLPPVEDFPSGDEVADATRANYLIEQMIRLHPEQYLWMHRRFKTRPDPSEPNPYA